ncbi:winged helix-turn-helix domain-containing protein [Arcobacter sp. s6]|jgi:molybdate transport system regulatory protein|uniref:winged helix-turn-helix domain-containing protein n=1 Tax=Arcobacter sp. s6 TaxID=3230363 RepID=UPI0034A071FD
MEIKVKVWIEDENRNLIFGSGKTEILNQIDQTGSIAKAAQNVGMNYKKAWSHIKILEEYIEDDLVLTKKGRAQDSGSKLTLKAKELMKLYKTLDADIKEYSQKRFKELFLDRESNIVKESKNV